MLKIESEIKSLLNFSDKDGPLDSIQEAMGSMGPWHIVIAIAISLGKFPISWHQLSIVFLAPPVSFTCISPFIINGQLKNEGCEVDVGNGTFEKCINFSYDRSVFRETIVTQVSIVNSNCQSFILFSFVD